MIQKFQELGVNMSNKIHFIRSHIDFFRMILERSLISMESAFKKLLKKLKTDIVVELMQECWLMKIWLFLRFLSNFRLFAINKIKLSKNLSCKALFR